MRILLVCSGNAPENEKFDLRRHHAFIYEQVSDLSKYGIKFDFFYITGRGILGYIRNIFLLREFLRNKEYDLIHAHYGLSAIVASFNGKFPFVATFHGCDINRKALNLISSFAAAFSRANIFVSEDLKSKVFFKAGKRSFVIPCGVNLSDFYPISKETARQALNFSPDRRYVLFASGKNVHVKNYPLAKEAVSRIPDLALVELSGKSREEVNLLMNACDALLLTSLREGSPQTIKEAMACNCPIISTKVGDVSNVILGVEGCFITSFEPADVTVKIHAAFDFVERKNRTYGRGRIMELGLDSNSIAEKVYKVYKHAIKI